MTAGSRRGYAVQKRALTDEELKALIDGSLSEILVKSTHWTDFDSIVKKASRQIMANPALAKAIESNDVFKTLVAERGRAPDSNTAAAILRQGQAFEIVASELWTTLGRKLEEMGFEPRDIERYCTLAIAYYLAGSRKSAEAQIETTAIQISLLPPPIPAVRLPKEKPVERAKIVIAEKEKIQPKAELPPKEEKRAAFSLYLFAKQPEKKRTTAVGEIEIAERKVVAPVVEVPDEAVRRFVNEIRLFRHAAVPTVGPVAAGKIAIVEMERREPVVKIPEEKARMPPEALRFFDKPARPAPARTTEAIDIEKKRLPKAKPPESKKGLGKPHPPSKIELFSEVEAMKEKPEAPGEIRIEERKKKQEER